MPLRLGSSKSNPFRETINPNHHESNTMLAKPQVVQVPNMMLWLEIRIESETGVRRKSTSRVSRMEGGRGLTRCQEREESKQGVEGHGEALDDSGGRARIRPLARETPRIVVGRQSALVLGFPFSNLYGWPSGAGRVLAHSPCEQDQDKDADVRDEPTVEEPAHGTGVRTSSRRWT